MFKIVNPEVSTSMQELKKSLSTIIIDNHNKDMKKILTAMQIIRNEILQEGG